MRQFLGMARSRAVAVRAAKTSLVVGTLLTAINQGNALLAGQAPSLIKLVLTYLVPFGVSTNDAVSPCAPPASRSHATDRASSLRGGAWPCGKKREPPARSGGGSSGVPEGPGRRLIRRGGVQPNLGCAAVGNSGSGIIGGQPLILDIPPWTAGDLNAEAKLRGTQAT